MAAQPAITHPTGIGASWSAPATSLAQDAAPRQLVVVVDGADVLLAPVEGAPAAGRLGRGARVSSEAEVNGEMIDGSPRWHLVSFEEAGAPARGFIHSSLVRDAD